MALTVQRIESGLSPRDSALVLARGLLEVFADRILLAYIEHGDATETVLPTVVVADVNEATYPALQKDLADRVFGPVAVKTKVRMPFQLLSREEAGDPLPTGPVVLLFQKLVHQSRASHLS